MFDEIWTLAAYQLKKKGYSDNEIAEVFRVMKKLDVKYVLEKRRENKEKKNKKEKSKKKKAAHS